MTNTNDTQTQTDDILGFNPISVDRSSPLLVEGLYDLEVRSVERKTNEEKGTQSLHIKLVTTRPAQQVDGSTMNAGWPVMHYIGLTESEKRTKKQIQLDIVRFLDAMYGKDSAKPIMPLDAHVGKILTAKLRIEEGDGNFGPSNRVKQFIPLTK